jgi:hypothetical protein
MYMFIGTVHKSHIMEISSQMAVKCVLYVQNMHYLAIKCGIILFAEQMGLKGIRLNKINSAWKDKCHTLSLICGI